MKRFWAAVAIIAVVTGLFFFFRAKNSPIENSPGRNATSDTASSNSAVAKADSQNGSSASNMGSAASATGSSELAAHAASPNPSGATGETNEPPLLPPAVTLDKARVLVHNYHAAFGENPVGTNPEIVAALSGKNPKSINFLAESGLRVNGNGELLDGYGTPLFFHQISGQEMEIRSAGPDRVLWTFDDTMTK